MKVTIFKNIFSKEPHYITVEKALERIKLGTSKQLVMDIRLALDKEKANKLKLNLPSICFSGKFGADRKDEQLIQHSGLIVLDFDDIDFNEALSDLKEFGVNDDELNLNFINIEEENEHSN